MIRVLCPIRFLLIAAGLALAALPWSLHGDANDTLYQAVVAVSDTAEEGRTEAFQLAVRQALGKLTGRRDLAAAEIDAVLQQAPSLVQEYRYQAGLRGEGTTELWVRFDRDAVDAAMDQVGLARWSGQRPPVLVWMVVGDSAGDIRLAGGDDVPRFERTIARAAWTRGLALRQPLLDLEDRVKLKPKSLWTLERPVVEEASSRYGPGPVVVVRIEKLADARWASRWRLIDGDAQWRFGAQAEAVEPLLARAMHELADYILERYDVGGGPLEDIQITVDDVSTVADYGRLMTYLRGLSAVAGLSVAETRSAQLVLRMQVRGGHETLARIASVDGVLLATDRPEHFRLSR